MPPHMLTTSRALTLCIQTTRSDRTDTTQVAHYSTRSSWALSSCCRWGKPRSPRQLCTYYHSLAVLPLHSPLPHACISVYPPLSQPRSTMSTIRHCSRARMLSVQRFFVFDPACAQSAVAPILLSSQLSLVFAKFQ